MNMHRIGLEKAWHWTHGKALCRLYKQRPHVDFLEINGQMERLSMQLERISTTIQKEHDPDCCHNLMRVHHKVSDHHIPHK
jgi:hypothetical protein